MLKYMHSHFVHNSSLSSFSDFAPAIIVFRYGRSALLALVYPRSVLTLGISPIFI